MNEDKKYQSIINKLKDIDYLSNLKEKKLWGQEKYDPHDSYIKGFEEVTPMTRKHFNMIAKVVNTIDDKHLRQQVAVNFASEIKECNPRFDMSRFVEACVKETE